MCYFDTFLYCNMIINLALAKTSISARNITTELFQFSLAIVARMNFYGERLKSD